MTMDFKRFKQINEERLNYHEMKNPSVISSYRNVGCGDGYRIYLAIEEKENKSDKIIKDASYTTTGCGFGVTALAMATEWVKGKSIEEAVNISSKNIESLFEFPPMRKNYPESAVEAMQKAISDYKNNTGLQPQDIATKDYALKQLELNGHLKKENLKQIILEGCNFEGIDFSGSDLSNAFLQNTNFKNGLFKESKLRGAFLNNANLQGADLRKADLRWCKLTGAVLDDALVEDAIYDIGTRLNPKYSHLFKIMKKTGKEIYVN